MAEFSTAILDMDRRLFEILPGCAAAGSRCPRLFVESSVGHPPPSQSGNASLVGVIAGGDEAAQGKPAPDLYPANERMVRVQPERCVVVEDSEPGVEAAIAAGMSVVIVPELRPPSGITGERRVATVASLHDAGRTLQCLTWRHMTSAELLHGMSQAPPVGAAVVALLTAVHAAIDSGVVVLLVTIGSSMHRSRTERGRSDEPGSLKLLKRQIEPYANLMKEPAQLLHLCVDDLDEAGRRASAFEVFNLLHSAGMHEGWLFVGKSSGKTTGDKAPSSMLPQTARGAH